MELKVVYTKYNGDNKEVKDVIFTGELDDILFNIYNVSLALDDIKCKYDMEFSTGFIFSNVNVYHSYSKDHEEMPGVIWGDKISYIEAIRSHASQIISYIYLNEPLTLD